MLLIKYIMSTSISPLPKTVQDAMKKERHRLDEQRNKSMRKRGRRSQYHRQSESQKLLSQSGSDDLSIASSMEESECSFEELPHHGSRLTPKQLRRDLDVEKCLYSA